MHVSNRGIEGNDNTVATTPGTACDRELVMFRSLRKDDADVA